MISISKKNITLKWAYTICGVFIAANMLFIANDFFWFPVLPAMILVILFAIFALDKLLLLIVFLTPFSVNLKSTDFGLAVSLPAEPLLLATLLIFIIKQIYDGKYDIIPMKHPITVLILINLLWIGFTVITSEMPLVSAKFFIARLWLVVPVYFIGLQLFQKIANIKQFIWLYIFPFTGVIFYTLIRLSEFGFDEDHAQIIMRPFYPSHTAFGAMAAIFIPMIAGYVLVKKNGISARITAFLLLIIFAAAILFSYSRAVWLSLVVMFFIFLMIYFRIKFWLIALAAMSITLTIFTFRNEIIMKLNKNRQESSDVFAENFQSISNISTDLSNTERINRWSSAIRMFVERPFVGFGPGTYQFQYAPYQLSSEKTYISTNAANKGNAHSEYLGPLAETGLPGALSFLAIILYVIFTGIRTYRKAADAEVRWIALALTLGLINYSIHALLNNYLDTDKASIPFWGFIAMITALDVYHKEKTEPAKQYLT